MKMSSITANETDEAGFRKQALLRKVEVRQLKRNTRLRAVYLFILFSLLILGGITFALSSFHKVFYPFGWDDDEGAVWWEAAHVTDLRVLYHPIQQYPYFVVPYPPVFHAATWIAARGTGDFLVAGRLICVFSALGISCILGLLVWRVSPRRIPVSVRLSAAALASLLCFRLDALNLYIPEMGVDLLALFLAFLGIYLFIGWRPKLAAEYGAFACFVLAVFTKQTMVAAPLACLVATALNHPAKALRYFVFCAAASALGMGYLVWATGGEILRHLFLYNARQPFSATQWITGMQTNLVGMIPIAAVACLAFISVAQHGLLNGQNNFLSWLKSGAQSSLYRSALLVLGLQLVFALLVTFTYGKIGSGVHYFLEWNFVCCPLAGLLFLRVMNRWRPASQYTLGGAAVFLLLILAALTGLPGSLRRIDSVYRLTAGERRIQDAKSSSAAAALGIVEQTPGPVFCENMVLLMKAHKEIPIEPGIQMFLAKEGIWDQSGFVNMISSQQFGVMIFRNLDDGFWTNAMVRAVKSNYIPIEKIGDENIDGSYYTVYAPLKRQGIF